MAKSDDAAAGEAEGAPKGDEQDIQEAVDDLAAEEGVAPTAREQELAEVNERHDRAEALAAVPQKVIDGNETAALETQTGQVPIRDMSDAPPPNELGPHHSDDPNEDPAKINSGG